MPDVQKTSGVEAGIEVRGFGSNSSKSLPRPFPQVLRWGKTPIALRQRVVVASSPGEGCVFFEFDQALFLSLPKFGLQKR